MRRYAFLILFMLVLALPFVLRMAITLPQPKGATTGESLTIVTPHNHDIRAEFEQAFNAWHQAKYGTTVRLDYRVPGGTNDVQRLLENTYNGLRDRKTRQLPSPEQISAGIDVVWGGGDYLFLQLTPQGILQPIGLEPAKIRAAFPEPTLAGVKLLEESKDASGNPTPKWVGVCLSAFGIVYNPDLYRTLNLSPPTQWHDLVHPKLHGLIALADPAHSGSAAVAYLMVIQRAMADAEAEFLDKHPDLKGDRAKLSSDSGYREALSAGWSQGMSTLLRIAANARYFSESSNQVPNDVGNGQAAAGMAIDFYGRVFQDTVGPDRCTVVLPAGATAITPDPVGIPYGVKGRQLELATRFVEFLISPEGQRLWIVKAGAPGGPVSRSMRRAPVRQDVYVDRTNWTDDVNPFVEAGGFNQRSEWGVVFSESRMIWVAAWIDHRDALKSAYATILKIRHPPAARSMLRLLASLPVKMEDVEKLRADRKRLEAQKQPTDEYMARQRIAWGRKFDAHYRNVQVRAEKWLAKNPGGRRKQN